MVVDCDTTKIVRGEIERKRWDLGRDQGEDSDGLRGYFRPDTVTRENDDLEAVRGGQASERASKGGIASKKEGERKKWIRGSARHSECPTRFFGGT